MEATSSDSSGRVGNHPIELGDFVRWAYYAGGETGILAYWHTALARVS
jgi:hypothetical protein